MIGQKSENYEHEMRPRSIFALPMFVKIKTMVLLSKHVDRKEVSTSYCLKRKKNEDESAKSSENEQSD